MAWVITGLNQLHSLTHIQTGHLCCVSWQQTSPAIQSICLTLIWKNVPGQSDKSASPVLHEGVYVVSKAAPDLVCQKVLQNSPIYKRLTKLNYTLIVTTSVETIVILIV